jgi:hypothetical protein
MLAQRIRSATSADGAQLRIARLAAWLRVQRAKFSSKREMSILRRAAMACMDQLVIFDSPCSMTGR